MSRIDLSYLKSVTGGDNDVIIEMIDLIMDETPVHLQRISDYHEKEKWEQLGAEAHKIKPMLLYVGLTDLKEMAQELEQNGKKVENLDKIPSLIKNLEQGFNAIQDELKEHKKLLLS